MKLPLLTLLVASAATSMACDRSKEDRNDTRTTPEEPREQNQPDQVNTNLERAKKENDRDEIAENKREATELVRKATATLEKMKKDDGLKKLLSESRGVFIVPDYGRGAVAVGARGGEGVLVTRVAGQGWSGPGFYDVGGISVGAQLGAEGGEIAMILMSDEALKSFRSDSTFSLDAMADLTLVDYSALAQATLGKDVGSVVFWSDTKGAFAGVSLSATNINWDEEENSAYYGKKVMPQDALTSDASEPQKKLQKELADI